MQVCVILRTLLDPLLPVRMEGRSIVAGDVEPLYTLEPDDRAALELAMACKKRYGAQVTALAAGAERAGLALRYALGRGADRAVCLQAPEEVSGVELAAMAAEYLAGQTPDLVLCGDHDLAANENLLGPFLAEKLGWVQATRAQSVEWTGDRLQMTRRLERGDREVLSMALPAVITVGEAGIQPRYVPVLALEAVDWGLVEMVEAPLSQGIPSLPVVEVSLPRPRPRKMPMPSGSMSAAQRMSFMMGGGAAKAGAAKDKLFEGTSDAAADRIVQFLREQGLLE